MEIYDADGKFKFKKSSKNDNSNDAISHINDVTISQSISNEELIVYNGKKIKSGLDFN